MAKQVIWSPTAKKALKETILRLNLTNGNSEQSEALYIQLQNSLHRIDLNPFVGQSTEIENLRYIVPYPGYTLFYRHSFKKIEIVTLWDNKQTPGEIKVVKKQKE